MSVTETMAQSAHDRMLEYAAEDDALATRLWSTGDTLAAAQFKGRAEGYRLAADMLKLRGLAA